MEMNNGCSSNGIQELQVYHQDPLLQHCTTATINRSYGEGGEGDEGFIFSSDHEIATSRSCSIAPVGRIDHHFHDVGLQDVLFPSIPSLPQLPFGTSPPLPPFYGVRKASSSLQFAYNYRGGGGNSSVNPLGLPGLCGSEAFPRGGPVSTSSYPFGGLQAEFSRMTAQEIMDAKALAASRSHSEAERRRRERINGHLAMLRSMLPNTTKTDKASLLAEVIQHVKELKRQTSEIAQESPLPTETDELTIDTANDEDGKFIVRASLCCDDRSDLLPDLIRTLKALKLRALKAEMTTLGGRVKNVLIVTAEEDTDNVNKPENLSMIQESLKAVIERATADETSSTIKRQRTNILANILEQKFL